MLSPELKAQIARYLNNQIDLAQLEDWLAPRLAGYAFDSESADAQMVAAIELGLAEMTDEILAEPAFRESLAQQFAEATTNTKTYFHPANQTVQTSSANATSRVLFPTNWESTTSPVSRR